MSQKNDVKKVTIVEFHPTQCPLEETKEETKEGTKVWFHPTSTGFKGQSPLEEPSSDSSESLEELTVGENEDYLDVEELILLSLCRALSRILRAKMANLAG